MGSFPKLVVTIALSLPLAALADEWTITQPIAALQVDGNTQELFLSGGQRWGSPTCPNVTYVRIPTTVLGHKELLSISLAAKMAGTPIRLLGNCGANGYFDAFYISLES